MHGVEGQMGRNTSGSRLMHEPATGLSLTLALLRHETVHITHYMVQSSVQYANMALCMICMDKLGRFCIFRPVTYKDHWMAGWMTF